MTKTRFVFSFVLLGTLTLMACNSLPGGVPSTGNGQTGQVVAVFLPEAVSLDVSELPDEDSSSAKGINDALPNATPVQRTLRTAARIIHDFHRLADRAMALGARIRHDMTDPTQTHVEGQLTTPNGQVAYKVDFAAFDIDGDGAADGSGNAVDTPVAVRMWVDRGSGYERMMCALVTTKPTQNNIGAGQMYAKPGAASTEVNTDFQFHVTWDRTDPAHKWNEAYNTGTLHEGLKVASGHARVDVRTVGGDSSIEKTVRSAASFTDNPDGILSVQSSVHFKPGSGFALLSGQGTGTGGTIGFSNVCFDLLLLVPATGGQCDGFDTQDMSFIDPPVGGETDFPADFPATPTF